MLIEISKMRKCTDVIGTSVFKTEESCIRYMNESVKEQVEQENSVVVSKSNRRVVLVGEYYDTEYVITRSVLSSK